jgi:hypothetical protein
VVLKPIIETLTNIKTVTMKHLIGLLILIAILSSCDWYGDYEYKVYNNSTKDIQIKIFVDYWYPNEEKIDSFYIKSSETKLIRVTPTENLGRNEDPHGVYDTEIIELGDFIAYSEGTKINRDFKDIKYWTYKMTGDQVGTYLMKIDDSLLINDN